MLAPHLIIKQLFFSAGKLTSQQIKAGYSALKIIAECVENNKWGSRHTEACNDFYTRIPHYFGYVVEIP